MRFVKSSLLLAALILGMLLGYFWNYLAVAKTGGGSINNGQSPGVLPTEQFMISHMTNTNGSIKTNLKHQKSNDEGIALGEEALSESLGLWMMYAVEKDNKLLFEQSVEVLRTYFWQDDGWVAWKTGATPKSVHANALVDDLRIAEALFLAAERWKEPEYEDLARKIGNSLEEKQYRNGLFTDFYDRNAKWTSDVLTLSYLNAASMSMLQKLNSLDGKKVQENISFLENLPMQNNFFPFSYNLTEKQYRYHQEVNLIDQLYIVLHRAQAGTTSPEVWEFIKQEFTKNGLLYGRYDAITKKPAVAYESPSVYGLAIMSAIELGDADFAKDLYYRMLRHQTRNPQSEWFGAYMDYSTMDTHSFDNLVALLAERKLYNEGLLR
ncbi:glycosyl hydrolase lipoprotein [Brevibacillus daliensis]|uniref:glycosyl hydrolase lipoprotein n=1 Tax=Brevibacillus daliensis TaxID=2892995 RepID=UPI001E3E634A|nr:glycosyl hydrolase lipoprotein [Brevibacillus daliensis]